MLLLVIMFCLGLLMVLLSAEKLVKLSEHVTRTLRISPLIIGITVVAIGTSLPELIVSLVSIMRHDTGLALGNIIGSNIINVLLVFPIGMFIGKLRIGTIKTQRNAGMLFVATFVFIILHMYPPAPVISGSILLILTVVISIIEYYFALFGRTHEDAKQLKIIKSEQLNYKDIISGLFLLVGIIIGGILVVDAVEQISALTGISTTILGLTVTSVATSLPELFTAIFSQKNHQEKMTIGSILGSNMYNLLLIGGILSFFPLSSVIDMKEWVWLCATTIGFVLILRFYSDKVPPKITGVILLLFFFIYILTQK